MQDVQVSQEALRTSTHAYPGSFLRFRMHLRRRRRPRVQRIRLRAARRNITLPLLPPTEIVPSIFIMDVAASLHLLPGVWRDIHWRALLWLAAGCLVGTPFGVYALAHVPAAPMTLALAVSVLIAAILLARGYALKSLPGPAVTFATGTASGLLNGSFGIGGPPVILFFFSSPTGAAAGRASMIALFLITDVAGLAWQGWSGLLSVTTLWRALLFLPALAAESGWVIAASGTRTRWTFDAGSCAC